MTNIRREVERIIEKDAAIKKGLARDIVNIRALARFIQTKIWKEAPLETKGKASLDAIISAIRRYPLDERTKKFKRVEELTKNCKLSMKSNIVDICLKNDTDVKRRLGDIFPLVDFSKGEILRIIVALESIKIIADEKNTDKITNKFPCDKVVDATKNLSEIIVSFPREVERTPGVVSTIATELTLNGINLVEIMSATPDLILIIDEKDAVRSYALLQQIK